MKKIILLLVAVALLGATACEPIDNEPIDKCSWYVYDAQGILTGYWDSATCHEWAAIWDDVTCRCK
jgi:hypothetical protein